MGRRLPKKKLVGEKVVSRIGTARHMVRAAVLALTREGLVVDLPKGDAQVCCISPAEVEETTEVQEMLHAQAAKRMLLPLRSALLESRVAIKAAHGAAVQRGSLSAQPC